MKCALVIPAWSTEEIFPSRTASSQMNYWQPLGTLYAAASMLKEGHEVKFLNGAFKTHNDILTDLMEFKPSFVGVYSTAFGWDKAVRTATDIKRLVGQKIFTAAGGPYPTAMKEKCLVEPFDAVVFGEGELTLVEMLKKLSSGKSLSGVRGTVCREGSRIVVNEPRPLIENLDALPFPARKLLDNRDDYIPPPASYKRKPVAVMLTSRGCDRRCIFCFQMDKNRKSGIRYRSVENVLDEMAYLAKQGYKEIKFIDDTFASDYDRAMTLSREIKKRKYDLTWFVSACVNQVDKELLSAFKEAGCWAILFGAESGVQKNLNTLKKGITLDQTQNAVRWAKEAGLKVFTPFVFGIPGETYEEGLKTIEFALKLNPDFASFHAITPFPGAELYDNAEKYGEISGELSDYTYQGAAFVPYTMTREDIHGLRRMAFKRFYSRPAFLLKKILALRSVNDVSTAVKGVASLLGILMERDIFSKPHEPNTLMQNQDLRLRGGSHNLLLQNRKK